MSPISVVGKFGTKGRSTMKIRRLIALGLCGLLLGSMASVFTASPATARFARHCDQKVDNMEKQAAKQYAKGKLTAEEYANVMAEIDYHRELWGC